MGIASASTIPKLPRILVRLLSRFGTLVQQKLWDGVGDNYVEVISNDPRLLECT